MPRTSKKKQNPASEPQPVELGDARDEIANRADEIVGVHHKNTSEMANSLRSAQEHANDYFQKKYAEQTDGYRRRCANISADLIEHARAVKNGSNSGAEEAIKTATKSLVQAREEYDVWFSKTVTPIVTLCDNYQGSFAHLLSEVATEERKHPMWSNKLTKAVEDRLRTFTRYRFKYETGAIESYFAN